jgi:hypothetical protein
MEKQKTTKTPNSLQSGVNISTILNEIHIQFSLKILTACDKKYY